MNVLIVSRNQKWTMFAHHALDGSRFDIRYADPDISYLTVYPDELVLLDLDVMTKGLIPVLLYQLRSNVGWMPYILGLSATNNLGRGRLLDFVHAGVDDILEDPYDLDTMNAKLSAIARRQSHEIHAAEETLKYSLSVREKLVLVDGQPVKLTNKAFNLFLFFYMNTDIAFSREDIYRHVWSVGQDVHARTLDTHISKLKRDLHLDGSLGLKMCSIYRFGYMLEVARSKAGRPAGGVVLRPTLTERAPEQSVR